MSTLKTVSLITTFIIILTGLITAQPEKGTPMIGDEAKFGTDYVSLRGEFTINLPKDSWFLDIKKPLDGVIKVSYPFNWKTPQGAFLVGYDEFVSSAVINETLLESLSNKMIAKMTDDGVTIISRKEISLDSNLGVEFRLKLTSGEIKVVRYYLAKNRFYTLATAWKEGESGESQIKILDTFKFIDGKAIIAKKIEESTPLSLPQSPVVQKLKSDAEDENLKGKVKTVVEEIENESGNINTLIRHIDSITDFNKQGNRIKQLRYHEGLPLYIFVYGYVKGTRMRNLSVTDFDERTMMRVGSGQSPSRNSPERISLEYKYADGKLVEEKWVRSGGSLQIRYVYNYTGNQMEKLWYSEDGKLNRKFLATLDKDGNEIERIYFDNLGNKMYGDSKESIKYDSFDENGNWTKKTISRVSTNQMGKESSQLESTTYRTITYYP